MIAFYSPPGWTAMPSDGCCPHSGNACPAREEGVSGSRMLKMAWPNAVSPSPRHHSERHPKITYDHIAKQLQLERQLRGLAFQRDGSASIQWRVQWDNPLDADSWVRSGQRRPLFPDSAISRLVLGLSLRCRLLLPKQRKDRPRRRSTC